MEKCLFKVSNKCTRTMPMGYCSNVFINDLEEVLSQCESTQCRALAQWLEQSDDN